MENENKDKRIIDTLPLKQQLFIRHYTNGDNKETFQNGRRSAMAAKYSEKSAHNTACTLLKNIRVKEAIRESWDEFLDEQGLSEGYVLAGIMHNEKMLREKGDYKGAEICTRDLGSTLALFSDNLIIAARVSAPEEELSPATQQAAIEAANAYKLSLSRSLPDIEQPRNTVSFVPSTPIVDSPEPQEITERVPADMVGRGQSKPTHTQSNWK